MNTSLRILVLGAAAIVATAIGSASPRAYKINNDANTWICALSANGQWGVSQSVGDRESDNPQGTGGFLVEISTGLTQPIAGGSRFGYATLCDVADNGTVVGSMDLTPAVWNPDSHTWQSLPLPQGCEMGAVLSITPDGSRAVGYGGSMTNMSTAVTVLYDLSTMSIIPTPGMPTMGMTGRDYHETAPCGISADGRYILGMVAQSYMMDEYRSVMWAFVYDTVTATYTPIGWSIDANNNFTPRYDGQNFIDNVAMSRSGQWVTGVLRMARPIEGSMYANDYCIPFRYHVPTDNFEIFDADADHDVGGFAIDDNGTIYGAQPWENPYCDAVVRAGNYFYPYSRILTDAYNFSLSHAIADDVVGRPTAISANGLVQAMRNGPDEGYMLILDEPLANGASSVDLLAKYSAEPASGTVMSKLRSIQLTFDRSIELVGSPTDIKVRNANGNIVASALSSTAVLTSNSHVLSIGLRTFSMEPGVTYTVDIPAGMVCIKGDVSVKNHPIKLSYIGRGDGAVAVTSIYPTQNSPVSRLDASTNPIVITFDSPIKLADDISASLYEGEYSTPKATLLASVAGNNLYLYPGSTQYLFAGNDYRVEIPAGIVTDMSGNGASEPLTLNYKGVYVREVNADDTYLFRADGSIDAFLQFITFDGDELTPAAEPESWGFTATTPWWGVTSSETSADLAFASHSMYANGGGKSDDWMMTPQLFIPDENVSLSFDLQGYRFDANDYLSVFVYESPEVINSLNHELADRIRYEGTLVFHEKADPGASMGTLEGEWTHINIPLDYYAGKDIYIAFVNENDRQSALFVDNIVVMHNVDFTVSLLHPTTVVTQSEIAIEGTLNITSESRTFTSIDLTLADASGANISHLSATGLNLKRGDSYPFRFAELLPLKSAEVNSFTLTVSLDDVTTTITDNISNLMFMPNKRVVLEEYTGSECGNCPLGILAIDRLKEMYPKNFIPITLRCYQGDVLGSEVTDYAAFLGLQAAPSGLVNRSGTIYHPSVSVSSKYYFSGQGITDSEGNAVVLWSDAVADELTMPAEADIEFAVDFDATTRSLTIPCEVKFALNTSNRAIHLLGVVLEDQLLTYQVNYMNTVTDDALLPWSAGGSLAQHITAYTFDDVARGIVGRSYNGTGGLIPADIKGGVSYFATLSGTLPASIVAEKVAQSRVAVLVIDDVTGRILNANIAPVGGATDGIESVVATPDMAPIRFIVAPGRVIASEADALVEIYSLDGRRVSVGRGEASTGAFTGPAIVRSGSTAAKIVIK